jgi:hypothetical protein
MNAYRTLRPVQFAVGTVLVLSHDQAERRQHVLHELEPGVYTAKERLEFKAGEFIGLLVPPGKGDSGLALIGPLEIVDGDGSGELGNLGEGGLLTIDDSIDSASAGEKIEPGVQIQPESGDLAPVSESKLADPTPVPESKPADPTPVPESKPAAKGKGKK